MCEHKMSAIVLVSLIACLPALAASWQGILIVSRHHVQVWSPYTSPNGQLAPNLNDLKKYARTYSTLQIVTRKTDGHVYFVASDGGAIFDPINNSTIPLPALPTKRYEYGATLYRGDIIVCGNNRIDNMPCIRYNNGTWSETSDYPQHSRDVAMVTTAGRMYAFGGHDSGILSNQFLNNVYKYQRRTKQWVNRAPLPQKKSHVSAVAYNETNILVCGGERRPHVYSASCHMYNVQTNRWTIVHSLNYNRVYHQLVKFKDSVYCLGGLTYKSGKNSRVLDTRVGYDDTVERYDQRNGWSVMSGRMAKPDHDAKITAIF